MGTIANNPVAQLYDHLQHSIDWCTASDDVQISVMRSMKSLLMQSPSYTPIWDHGCDVFTGDQLIITASDQCDNIVRRLARLESNLKRTRK